MAEKTITFSVEEVCGVETIVADPPVIVMKNNNPKIKFDNQLDVAAEVRFYAADDKNGTMVNAFCPEVNEANVLEVPSDSKEDCRPNEAGNYSFTVVAPPYPELDPIIIIEDVFDADPIGWVALFATGIGGAVFGAFGYRALMNMRTKNQGN